jgi:hypothetical protein
MEPLPRAMLEIMRDRSLASILPLVVASVACSSKRSANDEPTPDACVGIRARFNAEYARRTDTCQAASDCACYNPVGGKELGCGGVTDAATAKRLEAIQADFFAASCEFETHCAAWICAPRCESGHCSR